MTKLPDDLAEVVAGLIAIRIDATGEPITLAAISKELKTPKRTLQEKLKAKGKSFYEIRDMARRDYALEEIAAGASVAGTAERLQFASPNAFNAAFKRWTGLAPTKWAPAKWLNEWAGKTGKENP